MSPKALVEQHALFIKSRGAQGIRPPQRIQLAPEVAAEKLHFPAPIDLATYIEYRERLTRGRRKYPWRVDMSTDRALPAVATSPSAPARLLPMPQSTAVDKT